METEASKDASGAPASAIKPACGCGGKTAAETNTGAAAYPFVYAIGKVEPRFPRVDIEKEFRQAVGRAGTAGQTDNEAFHTVLSQRENRYLARKLCWMFTIQGMEAYILQPRDSADYDLLLACIRPTPGPGDMDAVIGVRGPTAPPEMCGGVPLPILFFDQLYSFSRETLIGAIPKPAKNGMDRFKPAAEAVFDRVMQMTDNAGAADEHRALNYLAMRYPAIYSTAAEAFASNCSLSAVDIRPSRLSGPRRIVDAIFSFTHRDTDVVDKYFARVDVSEEFPFLVTKMSPYYDR
ncbi:MAG TPA: hypothetical protein VEC06_16185 [Paucimonas sp.]|nr:hypothetical protein [Paucimonas sp.]